MSGLAIAGEPVGELPRLDLSGPRLARALAALIGECEPRGGVECYLDALAAKCTLFADRFGGGRVAGLDEAAFLDACAFVAPARRRVGEWLDGNGFEPLRAALVELLEGQDQVGTADRRMAAFRDRFAAGRAHDWTRDLAAEVLHFTAPGLYPLITRWMWDSQAGTGVLAEIWHGEAAPAVGDGIATHVALRRELAGYLHTNGAFREVPMMVDLLCARIYGDYLLAQGSAFLRVDFSGDDGIDYYTRRMLGLDGIDAAGGRTRVKRRRLREAV